MRDGDGVANGVARAGGTEVHRRVAFIVGDDVDAQPGTGTASGGGNVAVQLARQPFIGGGRLVVNSQGNTGARRTRPVVEAQELCPTVNGHAVGFERDVARVTDGSSKIVCAASIQHDAGIDRDRAVRIATRLVIEAVGRRDADAATACEDVPSEHIVAAIGARQASAGQIQSANRKATTASQFHALGSNRNGGG